MSGIRFCSECLNILHPEEAKNEHRLLFVCKSCDYREYMQDSNSIEDNKIYQRDFIQTFTEASVDPDFSLDPSMPRENIICPNCRYTECAYFVDRETGDKSLRKVYVCCRIGKTGKPECKNVFMPIRYQKMSAEDQKSETYAYREFGQNNQHVLLMVHGNYTSSYIFERTFTKLAEAFRVIAPDLRGFGLSSYVSKLNSFNDLAKDLSLFLKELKIEKVSILGWDIGAAVAMLFAADYPGEVDKLILVNPIGLTGKTFIRDPYNEENYIDEWPEDYDKALADKRMVDLDKALKIKDKAFFEKLYLTEIYSYKYPEPERLNSYIESFYNQKNVPDITKCLLNYDISRSGGNGEIDMIQSPTLILVGEEDFRTPADFGREIKDHLGTSATIKEFDAGHCIMEDRFEDFIKSVAEFCYDEY